MQIFGVVRDLMQDNMTQTFGVIMGCATRARLVHSHLLIECALSGANRKGEQEKLGKGVNLLVCTPGRLLDHLQSTAEFNVKVCARVRVRVNRHG